MMLTTSQKHNEQNVSCVKRKGITHYIERGRFVRAALGETHQISIKLGRHWLNKLTDIGANNRLCVGFLMMLGWRS